ncbi:MAG: SH3 domain-containing protein [Caldilineaceae bacterium]
MFQNFLCKFSRYWIIAAVLMFSLLSFYTSEPSFGAAITPTPDVHTVPEPESIMTPTNTPFPTPTPIDLDSDSGGGATGGGAPPATRQPDNNDDAETTGGGAGGSTADGADATTPDTAPEDSSAATGLTGAVAVTTLNLRKEPSGDAHIIDTLFSGERVEIRGRDSGNGWWYICCGAGAQRPGWVSAQYITPDFDQSQALTLLPVLATTDAPSLASSGTAAMAADESLQLIMRPVPAFAWQGQTVVLHLALHNRGNAKLTNVSLRDDLPPQLHYVAATISGEGAIAESGTVADGSILTLNWPEVQASAQVTATLTVRIDPAVPNGALIDNLAAVKSDQGVEALAGITLAMPPTLLPHFR